MVKNSPVQPLHRSNNLIVLMTVEISRLETYFKVNFYGFVEDEYEKEKAPITSQLST